MSSDYAEHASDHLDRAAEDHHHALPPVGDQYLLGTYRIRRCTYRRMTEVAVPEGAIYDVECLFPDRRVAIPLGDLAVATAVCNACTAPHIFRPDED